MLLLGFRREKYRPGIPDVMTPLSSMSFIAIVGFALRESHIHGLRRWRGLPPENPKSKTNTRYRESALSCRKE